MTEIYVDGSADNTKKVRESYTSVWVPGRPGIIKVCPATTNNEAEYLAVIEGIRTAELLKITGPVTIVSDSQLVVNQILGAWKCKEPRLQELKLRALKEITASSAASLTFRWCRRDVNQAGIELEKFTRRL